MLGEAVRCCFSNNQYKTEGMISSLAPFAAEFLRSVLSIFTPTVTFLTCNRFPMNDYSIFTKITANA